MKKNSSLIGIAIGFAAIFGAFWLEGGAFRSLFLIPAMLIVLGGTFAAAITGSSLEHFLKIPELMRTAFFPKVYSRNDIINQVIYISSVARRSGLIGLEKHLKEVEHPFLKKLFQTCVDGAEPEVVMHVAETEIDFLTARHQANIGLFTKMGGYSPTMGIIGTVMGLISTLAAAGGDPNELIRHIASAFIATLWGIFMANIVWLPIADRLRMLHNEEVLLMQIIAEGARAVQLGQTPSVIRAKLASALPPHDRIDMGGTATSKNTTLRPEHS
ncbi:MAG TPA: MotA/TolQ/ExbB proton channel family protein [Patescibacteria group bacterium]|nr:MotA/TolQ/ExbB proton channel family protein [Patescibacteria group bacterium]